MHKHFKFYTRMDSKKVNKEELENSIKAKEKALKNQKIIRK